MLECVNCGVIYRSRQFWVGNQDPESGVVRSEVKHVWEGVSTGAEASCFDPFDVQRDISSFVPLCFSQSDTFLTTNQNAAQRVLDGMNYVIQSVSEYSTGPTKAVTAWLTDQVAPPYWRPNTEITVGPSHAQLL